MPENASAPIPFPGGVADPTGSRAFVADASGGIQAINLQNGTLLWRSTAASTPLLVHGDDVLAEARVPESPEKREILQLRIAEGGRVVGRSGPLAFPDWLADKDMPGGALQTRARVRGRELQIDWQASTSYAGGAHPSRKVEQAARHEAAGRFHVDLVRGVVEHEPRALSPVREDGTRSTPYERGGSIAGEAWATDSSLVSLTIAPREGSPWLSLERRAAEGKEPAALVPLLPGEHFECSVTLDGSHVFVRPTAAPMPDWTVFSAETGREVARIASEPGAASIAVIGDRAYYLVSIRESPAALRRVLVARDLSSGGVAWRLDLGARRSAPKALPR